MRRSALALAIAALPFTALATGETELPAVAVRDTALADALAERRPASSDSAQLLLNQPGVSVYGAGGVSSLPAIHGMADDRVRTKVDGMDLISACANHMNPPLSYIDPSNVATVKVFAGITPVSLGGDSIGGTIVVDSAAPVFAAAGQGSVVKGQAGAYYRSNGNATGVNLGLNLAGEQVSVSYHGALAEAENYKAAKAFKPAGLAASGRSWLAGDEVGSTRYKSENHALGFALRNENHLLELKLGTQHIPYQGFPNQRMDMTGNDSQHINLRYTGQFAWGSLEARVYQEETRHKMNFGDDKQFWYGNAPGMPMDTRGKNTGATLKASIALNQRDLLRVGAEYQRYRLDDWWAPSGSGMMMGPGTFWNINNGQRDRVDLFAEWEARWTPQWLTQLGVRGSRVDMDAGTVRGYNTMAAGMGAYGNPASASSIPGAFNAADRSRTDNNLDLTALARYTPDATQTYEFGYARKTRSPNLYERYTWSTNNTMVMNMNNWYGDGNGYVGNLDLKPEVAHTLSATARWHDATKKVWNLSVTPYLTYVDDYIDAVSCASIGKTCPTRTDGFLNLSLANQNARLYGIDIAGFMPISSSASLGDFTVTGLVNYTRGKNRTTGDNLYNIMPLNGKLALVQNLGNWTTTVEAHLVAAKDDVAQVRKEIPTGGYGLLNLRGSYEWKQLRLDLGIDNLFNRAYALPLGGAYIGQGATMGTGVTWGTAVPGPARSLYTALTLRF
jgi:iron complex outermembrane receptor protein